jgi:hypothetical protein
MVSALGSQLSAAYMSFRNMFRVEGDVQHEPAHRRA